MASTQAKRLYRVVREMRRGSQVLSKVGASLHRSRGVTTAEREVLEFLAEYGSQTVPTMARARGCSRQHIQARVDSLREQGLVRPTSNPAHRKSSLIVLTERGKELFAAMSQLEAELFEVVGERLSAEELAISARTLAIVNRTLEDNIATTAE